MNFQNLTEMLREQYGVHSKQVEPNHWMFEVKTRDGRTQVTHLLFKERKADGKDVSRFVVNSPIGPVPKRYDLEQLLRRNAELDVGAICVEDFRDEDNQVVAYLTLRGSHLIATADFEEIWEMIEKVAHVADRLERDIYARDLH